MKRIVVLVLLVASTLAVMAQSKSGAWSVTPHVGVSRSSMTGSVASYELADGELEKIKPHSLLGFVGGVDVMYKASDIVGISAGVSFVQAGCKYKDEERKGEAVHDRYMRMNYIAVPVLAHSYLTPRFSINAGIEPTFLIKANNHEEYQTYDVDAEGKKSNFREFELDYDVKNAFRKFGLSIPIGVSYEYENVVLGALYHVGVFNVSKFGDSSRNSILEVSVGYKFNL
ncbi:MAG: porin family protein [Prevotella fusca]|uniref:porin family protein n=1 Tax=Prevotella fusca TaxID=589436 RepID=UPI003FA0E5BA